MARDDYEFGPQSSSLKVSNAVKRHRQNRSFQKTSQSNLGSTDQPAVDETSPVIQMFRGFQTELDMRHDKYERLVKLSRDITIESKRLIFQLHRIDSEDSRKRLSSEVEQKLHQLQTTKWRSIAEELQNEDPYHFLRAYSPGLQEYIEALSFWHYIGHETLISLEQVEASLTFSKESSTDSLSRIPDDASSNQLNISSDMLTDQQEIPDDSLSDQLELSRLEQSCSIMSVHVPPMEYMLGLTDLTGELMRMAIGCVGHGDLAAPFKIGQFIQSIHDGIVSFGSVSRDLTHKLSVLRQSLKKVEATLYTIQLRGSEIPKHLLANVLAQVTVASSNFEENDDIAGDF